MPVEKFRASNAIKFKVEFRFRSVVFLRFLNRARKNFQCERTQNCPLYILQRVR